MSDQQNQTDAALSRLDQALARIDAVIDAVTRRIETARQDREGISADRDKALSDLAELRGRYDALQAKAEHAAGRIDALIAVVERSLADGTEAAPAQAVQQAPEGGQELHDQGHQEHGHHDQGQNGHGHHDHGHDHQQHHHGY